MAFGILGPIAFMVTAFVSLMLGACAVTVLYGLYDYFIRKNKSGFD